MLSKAGRPYSLANVRTICNDVPGVGFNLKNYFGWSHREQSLKIPRHLVDEDQLNKIDSCKYIVVNDTVTIIGQVSLECQNLLPYLLILFVQYYV